MGRRGRFWTPALVVALAWYAADVAALAVIGLLAALGRLSAGEALSGLGVVLAARLYPRGPGGRGGPPSHAGASSPAAPPASLLSALLALRRAVLRLVELALRVGRALGPSLPPLPPTVAPPRPR